MLSYCISSVPSNPFKFYVIMQWSERVNANVESLVQLLMVLRGRPRGGKGPSNDPKAGPLPGLGVGAGGGEFILFS